MYALDDLFQPEGALKEAMELAADLYGAGRTFFSINGTTACIEAMIWQSAEMAMKSSSHEKRIRASSTASS